MEDKEKKAARNKRFKEKAAGARSRLDHLMLTAEVRASKVNKEGVVSSTN